MCVTVKEKTRTSGTREVIWLGVRSPTFEYFTVKESRSGSLLSGVVTVAKPEPFVVSYRLVVNREFNTRSVTMNQLQLGGERTLKIERRKGGEWYVDERMRRDLADCLDVDLGVSPSTNTLPIRRTKLKVGEVVELAAAWVNFPSLKVQRLGQSYERLGRRSYRYRSESGFSAKLDVDDFGLVTRYGNIWKQIPSR